MASPPPNASAEDVMEDLQLYQVLLSSLEEERPDALAERDELRETIRKLESRLAEMRGETVRQPVARPPSSSSAFSRAQMDGSSDPLDDLRPLQASSTAMSPPAQALTSRPAAQPSSRFLQPLPTRKRTRGDANLSDPLEPVSKRTTPTHPRSASITPSIASTRSGSEEPNDSADSSEELRKLLGFDDDDGFLEEQRKAEQWLQERKEQERRDAEYARMLQEGLYDPPAAELSQSDSLRSSPPVASNSGPPYTAPAPLRPNSSVMIQEPVPESPSPFRSLGGRNAGLAHSHPHPSSSNQAQFVHHRSPVIHLPDSDDEAWDDDEDLEEISHFDFGRNLQRRTGNPSALQDYLGPNATYSARYPWIDGISSNHQGQSRYSEQMGRTSLSPGPGMPGVYGPNVIHNTLARYRVERAIRENPNFLNTIMPGRFPSSMDAMLAHGRLPGLTPGSSRHDYESNIGYLPDSLAFDPKKTQEEIKQLLENIRPDSELDSVNREGTPEALKFSLMEHQKLGLSWMKSMEEGESKGGILADDMGLGKTIQALSLIVSRPSDDPENKSTLIIAPVSLMQQWKREIERMLKPGRHQRSVYVLHGDRRAVSFKDLRKNDIVLTTFGTMASELKRKKEWEDSLKRGGLVGRKFILPVLGQGCKWHRVIIDEAQCIKNRNTKAALACCEINATYRWCMSGTPMMNSVEELHSLLKFLRIKPYNDLERFNMVFTRPLKSASGAAQETAMKQLQALLRAVLLRRTKSSKIDGKPILQLPPRVTEKVHAVFSEDEEALYSSLENKTQLQFNRYLNAGSVGRNYSNILVLLLRLRQACCHPHLMSDFSVEASANTDEIDLVFNAEQFGKEVVVRLKDNDDLECPICIDAVENPVIFFPCGHSTCAECFSRISDPALAVQQGNDGTVEVKCPNCRGKVDPKKVTDHNTFRKVHYSEGPGDAASAEEAGEASKATEAEDDSDSDDDSDDEEDLGSLSRFIVPDNVGDSEDIDNNDEEEEGGDGSSQKKKRPAKGKGKQKKIKKTLAQLKKEASKNQKSKRKYLRRLEKTWVTSAKIEKTLEVLEAIQERGEGEKTIIFSQFTSLLDLLEVPVSRRGWGYRRYDGSMKPADRNAAVLDFTDNPECKIMLVSLKAGNSGLNLVAASQVIIFDPFWNPYIEEQAIDRAHRIGQMREVQIHRILVPNTVEDRILALQDKKRELIEGALDEKAAQNVSRLGTRELAYLFGINQ